MAFTTAIVAGLGAVNSIQAASQQKKAARAIEAQAANAKAEREAATAKATQDAYAAAAFAKRSLRENSLFTGGGTLGASSGQQTLGV
jgi:hypothetical protein